MTAQLRSSTRFHWTCLECGIDSASNWERPSEATAAAMAHNRIAHAEAVEEITTEVPC